jgi:hypothetical protein
MRAHHQNSDTANTFEEKRVLYSNQNIFEFNFFRKGDVLTSSFSIPNALTQAFLFLSVFRVEYDFDSGYCVQPA